MFPAARPSGTRTARSISRRAEAFHPGSGGQCAGHDRRAREGPPDDARSPQLDSACRHARRRPRRRGRRGPRVLGDRDAPPRGGRHGDLCRHDARHGPRQERAGGARRRRSPPRRTLPGSTGSSSPAAGCPTSSAATTRSRSWFGRSTMPASRSGSSATAGRSRSRPASSRPAIRPRVRSASRTTS